MPLVAKLAAMRNTILLLLLFCTLTGSGQKNAVIREYKKSFTTYPFSDPDPIPNPSSKIYPYFRYDGFSSQSTRKEWRVVELENDFIKISIMPEVGGKIWSAVEKQTGRQFIYENKVVKFRDIAMRGPWTSGGIEANYGIIGHTPACATPVDYISFSKKDGSVSCVIGVLDLLTRTSWRIEINLPKDKAYFTTSSFWFNASPVSQTYYTWMNAGIPVNGDLQYIYPGTKHIGHKGEADDWPLNKKNGKDLSFYKNNDFGGPKSYHVIGKYTDFFGAYWHDDKFGMGRFSSHDDKPGKKIWIWGLSGQGMIWEKLLTDSSGQYAEIQSGRHFNQATEKSSVTPFKHKDFSPHSADSWTEYWFPVKETRGFVKANQYGALNVIRENKWLKIYFSPLQMIDDEFRVTIGNKSIYQKRVKLKVLQPFADSVLLQDGTESYIVSIGGNKMQFDSSPGADTLSRPVEGPQGFDWNSIQGLYLQGEEFFRQRMYPEAETKIKACLTKDANYLPALNTMAILQYNKMENEQALTFVKKSLSIDTYDPAANYYYGLINLRAGKNIDAKDGFDLATQSGSFRDAAYTELSKLYLRDKNLLQAYEYAEKAIDFNRYNVNAWQIKAVIGRLQKRKDIVDESLHNILLLDTLNHFARFEKYLVEKNSARQKEFLSLVRNELQDQTFLELGIWYHQLGLHNEMGELLKIVPASTEGLYWLSYITGDKTYLQDTRNRPVSFSLFFREETASVIKEVMDRDDWKSKYYIGLIYWSHNNLEKAREWFQACGEKPDDAVFYAARAELFSTNGLWVIKDLEKAMAIDSTQWRYGKMLINALVGAREFSKSLLVAQIYAKRFPDNYIIGMQHIKSLQLNGKLAEAALLLDKIQILPYEGATEGRVLYKETHLSIALTEIGKKEYRKALETIAKAKLWPENLGVGKPYQDQIDERLEDWLSYYCYDLLNDSIAKQQKLTKIINYVPRTENTGRNFSETNSILTAWALEKMNKNTEAEKYLDNKLANDPLNPVIKWCLDLFNKKPVKVSDNYPVDENYHIISTFIEMTTQPKQ